jgi:hypothetical protein
VDIKFDTVEGFLLVDQILHRKTQTFEVRHSQYTSGTSRIGMRVSEGAPFPLGPLFSYFLFPEQQRLICMLSPRSWYLQAPYNE